MAKNPHSVGHLPFMGTANTVLRGVITGIIVTVVLLLLLSTVALSLEDPDKAVGAFAYVSLALGSFACGIAAGRCDRDRRVTMSAFSGGGYVLVLWLISLFFRADAQNTVPPVYTLLCYAGCVAVAVLGGLITKPRRMRTDGSKRSPAALMRGRLGRR